MQHCKGDNEFSGNAVDATPAKTPTDVFLDGRHVQVRTLDFSKDMQGVFDSLCGPDRNHLWKYNIFISKPFDSVQEIQDFLIMCKEVDKSEILVIVDKVSEKVVGLAAYRCIDTKNKTIEVCMKMKMTMLTQLEEKLGYMTLSPELQRSAASTEANYLMARHVFEDLGYRRYQWMCDANNMPSRRAAERMGFVMEGTFRQHMILRGHNRDTMWYSIIDKEWPERKKAFETWLDTNNFDENGIQKISLIDLNGRYLTEPGGYELGEIVESGKALEPDASLRLEGRVVSIKPLNIDLNIQQLFDELCGPESDQLWMTLSYGPFKTIEEFRAFLETRLSQDDNVMYIIRDIKRDRVVGLCGYRQPNTNNRVIMLGFINFSPKLQRTTGATEAMYLLIRHAFEDLNYRRIEWGTNAQNEASRKAALRLGFSLEAVLRQFWIVRARNRDLARFAILDKEWPKRKKAFETWLSPDNFDENGVQKQSLSALMQNYDQ